MLYVTVSPAQIFVKDTVSAMFYTLLTLNINELSLVDAVAAPPSVVSLKSIVAGVVLDAIAVVKVVGIYPDATLVSKRS